VDEREKRNYYASFRNDSSVVSNGFKTFLRNSPVLIRGWLELQWVLIQVLDATFGVSLVYRDAVEKDGDYACKVPTYILCFFEG
jgi:hypothetical protein